MEGLIVLHDKDLPSSWFLSVRPDLILLFHYSCSYGSALLGRFGTRLMGIIRPIYNIWETVQKIFFTIDDEGLYDEPIVHTVGEIARVPDPITFQ